MHLGVRLRVWVGARVRARVWVRVTLRARVWLRITLRARARARDRNGEDYFLT